MTTSSLQNWIQICVWEGDDNILINGEKYKREIEIRKHIENYGIILYEE